MAAGFGGEGMTAKEIKEKALQAGFSACGIIPAEHFEEYRKALDERSKAFPDSAKRYKPLYDMVTPPAGGKSIIVCSRGCNHYKTPDSLAKHVGKMYLFDGRLPFTEEYRAGTEFETYLKNGGLRVLEGGVPDRWAAAKAGVGKFGRNNFTYTPEHGSYVTIYTWVVDAVLDYDPYPESAIAEECSEDCLACVAACPTGALCAGLSMEYGSCIPSMANDTEILPDAEARKRLGLWLYGCDICQDVCPMNARKLSGEKDFPLLAQYEKYLQPGNILEMDEETYKNIVNPRFWYIGEDGLWLWKCNALRAMINDGDKKYHALIKKYSSDQGQDPRIREVAQWGCEQLGL
jgi:epoxyqueuosine reductase